MKSAPAHFPFQVLAVFLLVLTFLAAPLDCRAQEGGGAGATSSSQLRELGVLMPRLERAESKRPGRPEITAFTRRELAFGLFVLVVGFVGLLVMLPSGIKPSSASSRHGHGEA